MKNKTYYESGKYYAVIWVNGHSYYKGPYNSRTTARRIAIQEQAKVNRTDMKYNPKYI